MLIEVNFRKDKNMVDIVPNLPKAPKKNIMTAVKAIIVWLRDLARELVRMFVITPIRFCIKAVIKFLTHIDNMLSKI